jgi:hypothetical protein
MTEKIILGGKESWSWLNGFSYRPSKYNRFVRPFFIKNKELPLPTPSHMQGLSKRIIQL